MLYTFLLVINDLHDILGLIRYITLYLDTLLDRLVVPYIMHQSINE